MHSVANVSFDRRLRQMAVPYKDFSDLYEKMSGKGASASEAHLAQMTCHVLF